MNGRATTPGDEDEDQGVLSESVAKDLRDWVEIAEYKTGSRYKEEVKQVIDTYAPRRLLEQQMPGMLRVKDRYDEVFHIEVDGWCYGLEHYPGEVFPALVHTVVRELAPSLRHAVECNVVFDVLDLSTRLSRAAKYLVDEREITFSLLSHLPNPSELTEDGQFILGQVVDQVEQAYGGALERLERKWSAERRKKAA